MNLRGALVNVVYTPACALGAPRRIQYATHSPAAVVGCILRVFGQLLFLRVAQTWDILRGLDVHVSFVYVV